MEKAQGHRRHAGAARAVAQVGVEIKNNEAEAREAKARGEAAYVELTGRAEATKVEAIGLAEGEGHRGARARPGHRFRGADARRSARRATALVAVANAVAEGHITVVPEVLVTGGGGGRRADRGLAATLMRFFATVAAAAASGNGGAAAVVGGQRRRAMRRAPTAIGAPETGSGTGPGAAQRTRRAADQGVSATSGMSVTPRRDPPASDHRTRSTRGGTSWKHRRWTQRSRRSAFGSRPAPEFRARPTRRPDLRLRLAGGRPRRAGRGSGQAPAAPAARSLLRSVGPRNSVSAS